MSILNFQVQSIGESGQIPALIYINSNDTMAAVQVAGYLNALVKQGVPLSDFDMALVVTLTSPTSKNPQVNFYNIQYSGLPDNDWSLVLNVTPPPLTDSWLLGGNANPGTQVLANTDNVVLQSDTGSITLTAANAGQPVIILADDVEVTGRTNVIVEGATFLFSSSGVSSYEAGLDLNLESSTANVNIAATSGEISLQSAAINLPDLPASPPGGSLNVVWDPVGNNLYQGSASGGTPWLLGGNTTTGPEVLSGTYGVTLASDMGNITLTADASGQSAIVTAYNVELMGSELVDISSSTEVTINSPVINLPVLPGSAPVGSVPVVWDPVSNDLFQGSGSSGDAWLVGGNTLTGTGVLSGTDNVTLQSDTGSILLTAPTSGQTAEVLADNIELSSTTGITATGDTFSFTSSTGSTYTTTGGKIHFTSTAPTLSGHVDLHDLFISSANNNISIQAVGSTNGEIDIEGNTINVTADGSIGMSFEAVAGPMDWVTDASFMAFQSYGYLHLYSSNSYIQLHSFTSYIQLQAPTINIPTLPGSAPAGSVNVVWDPVGNNIYQGSGGSGGGYTWVNVTTSPQTLVAANAYVDNYASGTLDFVLPTSASFGQVFRIVGNGAGQWSITQNAGQNIVLEGTSSTVGTGGSVTSTTTYDCIDLVCTVANTTFVVYSSVGNFNIV